MCFQILQTPATLPVLQLVFSDWFQKDPICNQHHAGTKHGHSLHAEHLLLCEELKINLKNTHQLIRQIINK